MTAKIKMMIPKTKVKFPNAPIVLPMIEIRRFKVGHDFANLKTLSCKRKQTRVNVI